jgi:hypothetical protein
MRESIFEAEERFLKSADDQELRLFWLIQDALQGSKQDVGEGPLEWIICAALMYIPEAMMAPDPSVYAGRLDAIIPARYEDDLSPYRNAYETGIEMIAILRKYRRNVDVGIS